MKLPADSVMAYRPLAQEKLDPEVWRYLRDGDDGSNERAIATRRIVPRPLRDLRGGHTRLDLFGQSLDHPLLLAPIAYQRLFHPDGEAASAMAAASQGGQMIVSSLASQPFEAIAGGGHFGAGRGPWFQLYWQGDRARSLRLLQKAVADGCSAVVFTVDAPIKLATMALPGAIQAVNLEAAASPAPTPGGSVVFDGWMAQAPTWDDLAWLRKQTRLPLLVKGILHPDDAARVVECGGDGLIVSNHGGRVLPGAPAAIDALPAIVDRLGGHDRSRVPVLFDSGIRHGRDAFIAMALGARAVLVGRPAIWGLAANGAMGVAHVIRLLRDELEMSMALAGCARLGDIGPGALALTP